MRAVLHIGDCREAMRSMEAESVHAVVTSPPYFGLRDYGVDGQVGLEREADCLAWARREEPCGRCFVCVMREVFAEVWRVLRRDGTLWLNLGDSFNAYNGNRGASTSISAHVEGELPRLPRGFGLTEKTLKPKDLCLTPHRVALALQSDGWWVRMDNVWAKGSVMPESVDDRPTRSHEYVFLLAKSPNYFYDAHAVREAAVSGARGSRFDTGKTGANGGGRVSTLPRADDVTGRNRRSVWQINPRPFPEAHFAVMAPDLAEVCILAGTSERGCCPACLAPYTRITEPTPEYAALLGRDWADYEADADEGRGHFALGDGATSGQRCVKRNAPSVTASYVTTGWRAGCSCEAGEPIPCRVLDPFSGAATTGVVAGKLGRDYVGAELNPEYVEMSERRILREVGPLLVTVETIRHDAVEVAR